MIARIKNKDITVGIIGLGYVGLPLALSFSDKSINVIGFDKDFEKVKLINSKKTYIKHIGESRLKKVVDNGFLKATTDFSQISFVDVIILCVPTPLDVHREPDLSFITSTIETILPFLKKNQALILESTTYPGTTDEVLKKKIEKNGFTIGSDFFLIYSPEREDPGNKSYSTTSIPKVVGGVTKTCLDIGVELYRLIIVKVVPVSSTKVAEMTKLLENIYRSINIGLANEMKIIADKMGINIWEVIAAASTKPFGFTPFYPGPGLGGHCIPIDPFYLTWKVKEYGINTRFIELAGEINTYMPQWVISKTAEALNNYEKSVKGSKVLVLGLSYKKNIDDIRESPSVELLELLREKGADFGYIDPYYPVFPVMREHNFSIKSYDFSSEVISSADCIIISTDHDLFDYELLQREAQLIIDTRGRYKQSYSNVITA